ncbi:PH domain-containing protein [Sphingomonas sp. UYAg733]
MRLPADKHASLHREIERELIAGERLMWWKQPRPGAYAAGFLIWIGAIPWTVFALGWETLAFLPWVGGGDMNDALRLGFGIVMPLFGLPFVLIGFAMLAKPVLAIARSRNTAYAVSDRRIIRIELGRRTRVTSVFIDRIGPIQSIERKDGYGTLRIQTHSTLDSEGDRTTERFDMIGIPDVAHVRRLIAERQPLPGAGGDR